MNLLQIRLTHPHLRGVGFQHSLVRRFYIYSVKRDLFTQDFWLLISRGPATYEGAFIAPSVTLMPESPFSSPGT